VVDLPWVTPLLLAGLVLVPRLWVFPWTENVYGDAAARTELAQQWALAPHVIRSFHDGAMQFGPLHITLMGMFIRVFGQSPTAGQWVSLLFGSASAYPLWVLTRSLFGKGAAWTSVASFALWGLHIQASTTAASEAVGLFFMLGSLAAFEAVLRGPGATSLWLSALSLTAACAVRYDAWMLVPLLGAVLFSRTSGLKRTALFVLVAGAFPALWLWGNALDSGDPLFPLHFVDAYHRTWVTRELGWYQSAFGNAAPWAFRTSGGFFWPGVALMTLSPGVAVAGGLGAFTMPRGSHARWLLWPLLVPTAYFAYRAAVRMDFVPLARFAMAQVVLLLPFVWNGLSLLARFLRTTLRWTLASVLALAAAWSLGLAAFTLGNESSLAKSIAPLSPVTWNAPGVRDVARYLVAQPRGGVILDRGPDYEDIQVAFAGGLVPSRQLRERSRLFEQKLAQQEPKTLVLFSGGTFTTRPDVAVEGDALRFRHWRFRRVAGFQERAQVWTREDTL
jgi:hypothetical protein